MSNRPDNITSTADGFYLIPAGHEDLHKAYRAAVATALQLQNILRLPPAQCAVITREQRRLLAQMGTFDNVTRND